MTLTLDNYGDIAAGIVWFVIAVGTTLAEWYEDRHVNDEDDLPSQNAGKTLFRD